MSLLNLASDGLPNVLLVLYAAVARARTPPSAEELLDTVAPAGVIAADSAMARQTLNRWTELGLFKTEAAGAGLTLGQAPAVGVKDDAAMVQSVRMAARDCALAEQNNPDLWARQAAKAADLTRSLAWLMAQDVYRFRFADVESLESAQVEDPDVRLMQNDTRINGLKYWGYFMGFVRQPGGGDIDPTIAVREAVHACLQSGEELPAADFIERLAMKLPVLDGGAYRTAIEARLDQHALPGLQTGQLSTSLSRALLNLMLEEVLEFENRADVGRGIVLTGRDGIRADHRYSWVRLKDTGRRAP